MTDNKIIEDSSSSNNTTTTYTTTTTTTTTTNNITNNNDDIVDQSLDNLIDNNNNSYNINNIVKDRNYLFECIYINNDVREYKVRRKRGSVIYTFDYVLLVMLVICSLYHYHYSYQPFKSFSMLLLIVVIATRFFLKLMITQEESMVIMRELGVQLTRKYYLKFFNKVEFIDKTKIQSIVINEGISRYSVTFYMAFIVEGKSKMILAFEDLIPRINILLKVYRGTRSLIYGESEE
ncbi:putative glycosyltransferase [Cavenderia fasciculata]|uniref:Glycosyltransferase n=1 Tax=Cavenderia fasciculata TaxID=261658 RepID=F4Q6J6_CACFS|nr:putative glycosyltransferase [Cavenderia fasciculata]EGG16506.1 putative glycosyltransferase [Cavenderia fasciculata]|eukprot:XP_004354906.1 putative glycosyltransferase [Cavenderia fasciculata]